MLHLLSNFLYFGRDEIRELLKSLYRDIFRYRIVASIRRQNDDTVDPNRIRSLYAEELRRTRFLPIGNPSESSTHLLYFFRQQNQLSKNYFLNVHEIYQTRAEGTSSERLRHPNVTRYVFLDDFAGSGDQAVAYSRDILGGLRPTDRDRLDICYYVLFSTTEAQRRIKQDGGFDDVNCVLELSNDFRAFAPDSLYYIDCPPNVSRCNAKRIARHYGMRLYPSAPLGYREGQLILGFSHNIPDNTLPIFWFEDGSDSWVAPFPRFPKIYDWSPG